MGWFPEDGALVLKNWVVDVLIFEIPVLGVPIFGVPVFRDKIRTK